MTPFHRRMAGWRRVGIGAALLVLLLGPVAHAQAAPPKPDRPETARLVWTTLIALDHANETGDYSVLRELASPAFREANDPASLAAIFADAREPDIGLGRVVLYAPEYAEPPRILDNGMYRVHGLFPMRPEGIAFDLIFEPVAGEWRLFGIAVAPEEPRFPEEEEDPVPPPKPGVEGEG